MQLYPLVKATRPAMYEITFSVYKNDGIAFFIQLVQVVYECEIIENILLFI